MADDNSTDTEANDVVVSKGNSMVKIIVIVVLVIVLIAGSIGATLYFAGVIGGEKISQDSALDQSDEASKSTDKKGKMKKEPVYYAFDPAFVVNFNDGKSIRYLQLTLEIMTYNETVITDLEKHMPVIRNNLILMLSNLNYEVINTVAGKRKLQNEALTEIKSILLDKSGREGVEEVYFTGFVMQ